MINNKEIYFDVGANDGSDSLRWIKNNKNGIVYAFEPFQKLCEQVNQQLLKNNIDNYFIINKAISDVEGIFDFNISDTADRGCSSFLNFSENSKKRWPSYRTDFCYHNTIKTETIRLDNFIKQYNIPYISYLHVDTQGYDLKVLHSLGDSISIVEKGVVEAANYEDVLYINQNTKQETVNFLKSKNFRIEQILPNDPSNNEINIVFSRRKQEHKVLFDDLTIVIQGKLTNESWEFYKKHYSNYNVIISTWITNDVIINDIPENFMIIKNHKPHDHGHQNIYLQIYSTLYGLDLVNTKYCIKMRADEYISNIDYIYNEIVKNDFKLYTLPIWFRRWSYHAYHMSDHLIAGLTDNLRLMFTTALNRQKDHVSEVVLTRGYLEKKIPDLYQKYEDKNMMKQYFDILDLEKLKPYLLIANCFGTKFYNNFIAQHHGSINNIEDI